MYEVALMVSSGSNPWQRNAIMPRGLEQTRSSKYRILPTDDLCEWLIQYTKSHATIEMINRQPSSWGNSEIIGVRFGFTEAADAVLFKLTWS